MRPNKALDPLAFASLTYQVKHLGLSDYHHTWQAMRDYTLQRTSESSDQLWFTQHNPVYTLGRAGSMEHLLQQTNIPLIKIDRGGEVTYHGPGQLVLYVLIDIFRAQIGIRSLVRHLEDSIIRMLAVHGVDASNNPDAPGVYTNQGKIAALGLSCKRRGTYHGLSLNIDMDLTPFQWINPCGINQPVTSLKQHGIHLSLKAAEQQLLHHFLNPND